MHQALLNMHHLTPDKIGSIVEFLDSHPLRVLLGISINHSHARRHGEDGGDRSDVEAARRVHRGGEHARFSAARHRGIHRAILSDQYGASEGCGNASHCPKFVYHEDFEFGLLEGVEQVPGDPARSILATGSPATCSPSYATRSETPPSGSPTECDAVVAAARERCPASKAGWTITC